MDLYAFNPWWKGGKVPAELLGRKRKIFNEVSKYIAHRQILLLTGLRRAGKTTLLYQIIDELLSKGTNPYSILYFSFDEMKYDLEDLIKQFEIEVLRADISKQRVFLFFDEIHKLKDWASKIKMLYDLNPSAKIFLSGSAQIMMWKETRESLAGRFFDFVIKPLNFNEYLEFKEVDIDKKREKIFEKDLKRHMASFLRSGGFVEALSFDEPTLRKYFKESLLQRVIFIDIPQTLKLDIPELLEKLLTITASKPGFYLDYKNLANDLKIDQRTISNYVSYLEYALFMQKLYNYSKNLLTSEKKLKRLYLSNTAFTFALNPQVEFSLLLEQFFVNSGEAKFFSKTPQQEEIDIIHTRGKKAVPVEIKIRGAVGQKDVKNIFGFMERYELPQALLITLDTETTFKKGKHFVEAIPYWRYWSILERMKLN